MSAISDLIQQIDNSELRDRIDREANKLAKQKKFGLVFEEHLPECTLLYDIPVKKGTKVSLRDSEIKEIYTVLSVNKDEAICLQNGTNTAIAIPLNELVVIAEFGDPIYPYLQPIDEVCNAPDSDLWHTLIEADNYHALQFLEYIYPGKVDCIYIDPPYNTRAKDWKYNNDYVDPSDAFKHSLWLSMMKKRLKIAKKVLNPKTGVLVLTIDENEFHLIRALLDELFPEAFIQVVTIVINPKGVSQGKFSRVEEYAIYVFMPDAELSQWTDPMLGDISKPKKVRWAVLLRSGSNAQREDRPNMYYPILIDEASKKIIRAGEPVSIDYHPDFNEKIDGYTAVWPVRTDFTDGHWSVGADTLNRLIDLGYVSLGSFDSSRNTWAITYLNDKTRRQIDSGEIEITGKDENGTVIVEYVGEKNHEIRTVWYRPLHNAGTYGSDILKKILGEGRKFPFPKSIYAEHDTIGTIVKNNPNALVLDFFAGSGTTLNAVNLLNAEDGGNRRCILVTNNECSNEEEESLRELGFKPGDEEWENHGICKSVTWPRTKNSILGCLEDGTEIEGEYFTNLTVDVEKKKTFKQIKYLNDIESYSTTDFKDLIYLMSEKGVKKGSIDKRNAFCVSDNVAIIWDINHLNDWLDEINQYDEINRFLVVTKSTNDFKLAKNSIIEQFGETYLTSEKKTILMSDGFKTNANFFKLGFLDKNKVSLGMQFKEMIPTLWMKAGAIGKCPVIDNSNPNMLIFPENHFAVLNEENLFGKFKEEIDQYDCIDTIFLVTDYEESFIAMTNMLNGRTTYQLYRDYLDNFRINAGRNAR